MNDDPLQTRVEVDGPAVRIVKADGSAVELPESEAARDLAVLVRVAVRVAERDPEHPATQPGDLAAQGLAIALVLQLGAPDWWAAFVERWKTEIHDAACDVPPEEHARNVLAWRYPTAPTP